MSTKADRLVAALERFAKSIQHSSDPKVQDLYRVASGARQFIAEAKNKSPRPTSSQIVAGLEQCLRETPMLIQRIDPQWRVDVSRTFREALTVECPEFLTFDSERLRKVWERSHIRTEAEFYIVRHHIDLLEGAPGKDAELQKLYSFADAYEARS
jgi:hypothetical protein